MNTDYSEQIRSFIAIELPEEAKTSLRRIQENLKRDDPSCAKWVEPQSIHLTLKFLGNIGARMIDRIILVMKEAAEGIPPFKISIKGAGAFPNLRRVQTIWAGLEGDLEVLQKLQNNVETGLKPLGFVPENRPFTPHLTLARVRDTATLLQRQALGDMIAGIKIEANPVIEVKSFNLMKSQLTRTGPIYTCLSSVDL